MIMRRDVAVLAVRLDALAATQERLATELEAHRQAHVSEAKMVRASRRWWVGTVLAAVAGVPGVVAVILALAARGG